MIIILNFLNSLLILLFKKLCASQQASFLYQILIHCFAILSPISLYRAYISLKFLRTWSDLFLNLFFCSLLKYILFIYIQLECFISYFCVADFLLILFYFSLSIFKSLNKKTSIQPCCGLLLVSLVAVRILFSNLEL